MRYCYVRRMTADMMEFKRCRRRKGLSRSLLPFFIHCILPTTSSESRKQLFQFSEILSALDQSNVKPLVQQKRSFANSHTDQSNVQSAVEVFECYGLPPRYQKVTNLMSNTPRTSLDGITRQTHGSFVLNSQRACYLAVLESSWVYGFRRLSKAPSPSVA